MVLSALRALLTDQLGHVASWIEPQRRRVVERAYAPMLLTDGVGLPLLPNGLRLHLLPHVVPQVMNWKRIAGDGWGSHIKCGC